MAWEPQTFEPSQPAQAWTPNTFEPQQQTPPQNTILPQNMSDAGDQLKNNLGLTARYGVEGAMALPNMLGNAANSAINLGSMGINKLAGTNIPMLGMPSDSTSQALTQAGLPEPQGAQQRIVGDVSKGIAGLGSTFGLGALAPESSAIGNALTSNPMMQARGAAGAAGAAGGMRELGGGPIAQTVAGLAGGYGATRQPFAQEPQQPNLSQNLKDDARQAFTDANSNGAYFNDEASSQLPSLISDKLAETGKMNARLHGDTLSVLDDIKNDAEKGGLTLEDLHQQRQLLGQAVNNNLHPNGDLKPDALKASQAIDAIDEFINNAKSNPEKYLASSSPDAIQSFQNGMGLWSKAARASDIERIMERAKFSTQPASAMQNGFKQLVFSKRFNSYSPEDQQLIEKAATSSLPADILRSLGSRLIGVISAGTGHIGGGIAAEALSSVPRNLAAQMQINRGQNVLNNLAQPNTLMQSLPDAFKQMGTTFGIAPTIEYRGQ